MKIHKLLPIAFCAILAFNSCDDDDDYSIDIPSVVETNFSQKYPQANSVKWEKDNDYTVPYLKAEFRENGREVEVWYTENGTWVKTETEYKGTLPSAISSYLENHYATFRTDDIEFVETPTQQFYKIELEKGKHEVELSITEKGLVLFVKDNQETIPADVLKSFNERYPHTNIKEWEKEGNYLKAEFERNNAEAEAWFTYGGIWVKTETEYKGTLPTVITNYISNHYPTYKVDDVKWVETPHSEYFEIELEKGEYEMKLTIRKDGTLIDVTPDND